jgi:hypothetical protein
MTTSDRPAGDVDPKLLEILVCPLTKGPLEYDREKQELISRSPIRSAPASRSCCLRKRAGWIDRSSRPQGRSPD